MDIFVNGLGLYKPPQVMTNDAWSTSFVQRHRATRRGDEVAHDRTFAEFELAAAGEADARGASLEMHCAEVTRRHVLEERHDPFLGATERRVASDASTATEAAIEAARAALMDAGIEGSDVDLVLSSDIIPDYVSPSSANAVAHAVGASNPLAMGIDAACASALAQLELAASMIRSGRAEVALLTQTHLLLRAFPHEHPAAPGLGDAATAWVVSARPIGARLVDIAGESHGEHVRSVSIVSPDEEGVDVPWYCRGGASRVGSLEPEGAHALMRDTVLFATRTMHEACERADVRPDELSAFVSVQPRPWIPHAIAECLGRPGIAHESFAQIAHVGACGPAANWIHARESGGLGSGRYLGVYAQGAGFVRMGAVFELPANP